MTNQAVAVLAKKFGGELLPDNKGWTNRFSIKSESSSRLYTIAQNKANGTWGCSCKGWIRYRRCKQGFGSAHANEGMKMKKMKKKKRRIEKKLQRLAYVVYHAKEGSRRQIDAAIAYLNLCAKGRGTCVSI